MFRKLIFFIGISLLLSSCETIETPITVHINGVIQDYKSLSDAGQICIDVQYESPAGKQKTSVFCKKDVDVKEDGSFKTTVDFDFSKTGFVGVQKKYKFTGISGAKFTSEPYPLEGFESAFSRVDIYSGDAVISPVITLQQSAPYNTSVVLDLQLNHFNSAFQVDKDVAFAEKVKSCRKLSSIHEELCLRCNFPVTIINACIGGETEEGQCLDAYMDLKNWYIYDQEFGYCG